jgi:hypothetical protein
MARCKHGFLNGLCVMPRCAEYDGGKNQRSRVQRVCVCGRKIKLFGFDRCQRCRERVVGKERDGGRQVFSRSIPARGTR